MMYWKGVFALVALAYFLIQVHADASRHPPGCHPRPNPCDATREGHHSPTRGFDCYGSYSISRDVSQCAPLHYRRCGPIDIMDLRADDIGLIMALGDSFPAGFAAYNLSWTNTEDYIEFRNISYAMGSASGANTLANLFSHYLGREILGASPGTTLYPFCGDAPCPPNTIVLNSTAANLNAAISASQASDFSWQLEYLLPLLRTYHSKTWKVLTIYMGSNEAGLDPCNTTHVPPTNPASPLFFEHKLRQTLETLRAHVPKLVVYIVQNLDNAFQSDYVANFTQCDISAPFRDFLSPCSLVPGGNAVVSSRIRANNAVMAKVAKSYSVRDRHGKLRPRYDDFAVVALSAFGNTQIGTDIDIDFFSLFDCGHPNPLGHSLIAAGLWNEMFDRSIPHRHPVISMNTPLYCPCATDRLKVVS